jgi:hypothetical protein
MSPQKHLLPNPYLIHSYILEHFQNKLQLSTKTLTAHYNSPKHMNTNLTRLQKKPAFYLCTDDSPGIPPFLMQF